MIMRFKQFTVLHLFLLCFVTGNAQVYIPAYGAIVDQVSQSGILANLVQFENFGVKYRGTSAQANTLAWLKDQYLSYGYSTSQIVEDPFVYSGTTCKNLIVTKTGTLYPNKYVIVCGHFDTVAGPGTNDNGSGVTAILEIARLLQNIQTEYSVRFINFSGEEDGLRGSQDYVSNVVNATSPKMDIRLVFNLDQVGGIAGMTNNTITCERDQSSPTINNALSKVMTNQLINCVGLYSPLNTNLSYAYGSDYMPFQSNSEIITGFYETNESPYSHTANDLLVNMDPGYVYNVTKAAVGATLHFAVACTNCGLGSTSVSADKGFRAYPNPASQNLYIDNAQLASYSYIIADVLGKVIYTRSITSPSITETIDISKFASGTYLLTITTNDLRLTRKIIIN